jgi:PAS domain S-box-containing protein
MDSREGPERSVEDALRAELAAAQERNKKLRRLLVERAAETDDALQQLTLIIDNISDAIMVTDRSDRVRLINPAVRRAFGVGELLVGQPVHEHFGPDLVALVHLAVGSQAPAPGEVGLYGGRVGKAVANPLVGDEGEPLGVVTVVRDITFEKEVDLMKSEFIANVSHELRTPLTSILGFARIIDKRLKSVLPQVVEPDERTRRHIDQIVGNVGVVVSESRRLSDLVNDVLDLTRLDAGVEEWTFENTSINEVMEQAAAACAGLFDGDPELKLSLAPGLPLVQADARRVLQVVVNLISNASKFTTSGSISCSTERTRKGVLCSVRDTGTGIPEGDLEAIFERFRQVGSTMTDKPRGTGLGLALCRTVVERHGGRIWATSVLGEGSTFSFEIPA